MKDFASATVNERKDRLMPMFIAGLGEGRVRDAKNSILLLFELNDKVQMEQFNRFGDAAYSTGIAHMFNPLPDNRVEVRIPLDQQEPNNLIVVARRMSQPTTHEAGVETVRHIGPADPEHILSDATQREWNIVAGSPYQGKVLEPVQEGVEITPELRRRQELALAYALRPEGQGQRDLEEWIRHQQEVEQRQGTPPRTLLPNEWASGSALDRLKRRDEISSGAIKQAFPPK